MKILNYEDIINTLAHCAYGNRKVDTWEDIIAIINDIPAIEMEYIGKEKIYFHDGSEGFRKLYEVVE